MPSNLQGEFAIMENLGIKPNYAALGRKYDMDWRTVKKYQEGYYKLSSKSAHFGSYKNGHFIDFV